jgi:hypothetical protein
MFSGFYSGMKRRLNLLYDGGYNCFLSPSRDSNYGRRATKLPDTNPYLSKAFIY